MITGVSWPYKTVCAETDVSQSAESVQHTMVWRQNGIPAKNCRRKTHPQIPAHPDGHGRRPKQCDGCLRLGRQDFRCHHDTGPVPHRQGLFAVCTLPDHGSRLPAIRQNSAKRDPGEGPLPRLPPGQRFPPDIGLLRAHCFGRPGTESLPGRFACRRHRGCWQFPPVQCGQDFPATRFPFAMAERLHMAAAGRYQSMRSAM